MGRAPPAIRALCRPRFMGDATVFNRRRPPFYLAKLPIHARRLGPRIPRPRERRRCERTLPAVGLLVGPVPYGSGDISLRSAAALWRSHESLVRRGVKAGARGLALTDSPCLHTSHRTRCPPRVSPLECGETTEPVSLPRGRPFSLWPMDGSLGRVDLLLTPFRQ